MRVLIPFVLLLFAVGVSAAPQDAFDRELDDIERAWLEGGGGSEAVVAVRGRLTALEAKGPFRPRFWFLWGRVSHAAGDFHAATLGFTVAVRTGHEPRVARECLARSSLFWLLEQRPRVKTTRHALVASFDRVRALLAEVLADSESSDAVREEFTRLELLCLEAMGTVNHLARNAARTLSIYQELVERDPGNHQHRMSLSQALINQKRWLEALDAAKLARELNPDKDWVQVHAALGRIYSNLDKPDLAERHYAIFLAANPSNTRVLRRFGEHYFRNGRFGPGVEIYRRIIELTPDHASAYHKIATGLRRLGETEEAERFEKIYRRLEGTSDRHLSPNQKR